MLKNTQLVRKTVTEHSPTEMNFQKHHTQQAHIKLEVKIQVHLSEMFSFQSYQILSILTFQFPRRVSIAARADLYWGIYPSQDFLSDRKQTFWRCPRHISDVMDA